MRLPRSATTQLHVWKQKRRGLYEPAFVRTHDMQSDYKANQCQSSKLDLTWKKMANDGAEMTEHGTVPALPKDELRKP